MYKNSLNSWNSWTFAKRRAPKVSRAGRLASRGSGVLRCCWVATFLVATLLGGAAVGQETPLSDSAKRQIEVLMLEKAARTPAQSKIASELLYEMKRRDGDPLMEAVPGLRSTIEVEVDGATLVDIKATVTEGLLRHIEALGGRVVNSFAQFQAIRAYIPLHRLEAVAESPEVMSIRPADRAITNMINVSEGDVAHRADVARSGFGADGSNIKICALSDGVDALSAVQATGDLPAVAVLPGQAGAGSEGTAMLEIMFDLAPGADLGFATAFGGIASFAQNIIDLRASTCDVIVDDVFYFAEPVFQDGIIAQAVDQVVAGGALYFSSAGNSGNKNDGTSGVWEGDYVATTLPPAIPIGLDAHDFGSSAFNAITDDPPSVITLSWSDPQGGSSNDYDLFLLDPTGNTVFSASANTQNGTQDPFELIDSGAFNDTGNLLVVTRFSGDPRFLHLNTHRGELTIATEGQTAGHAAADGAFGVAAVNVAAAGGGTFTGGSANPVEPFSSDGPRRIFFNAGGTPFTPGNFSSTGGIVRQKPDIAAADGVMTATPGFNPFFGTSAAAPHAAAIAGLMLSVDAGLDSLDVRNVFNQTALDIEAPGVDRDSGVGIVDAFDALDALAVAPTLVVTPSGAFKPKGRAGGPFKPKKKTYTLTNSGTGPLSWRASDNKSWLKVKPPSGSLNAGQSTSVKVKLKKRPVNKLKARKRPYKGRVSFTNKTNGIGDTKRQVKLKVRPRPARRTVSTASIE